MSTYIARLDSHQYREYANVFEALVYLQHDMIMLKMNQHELHVRVDWDGNQQYEEELNEPIIVLSLINRKCLFTLNSKKNSFGFSWFSIYLTLIFSLIIFIHPIND